MKLKKSSRFGFDPEKTLLRTENDAMGRGTRLLESYVACHYVATEALLSTKPLIIVHRTNSPVTDLEPKAW